MSGESRIPEARNRPDSGSLASVTLEGYSQGCWFGPDRDVLITQGDPARDPSRPMWHERPAHGPHGLEGRATRDPIVVSPGRVLRVG